MARWHLNYVSDTGVRYRIFYSNQIPVPMLRHIHIQALRGAWDPFPKTKKTLIVEYLVSCRSRSDISHSLCIADGFTGLKSTAFSPFVCRVALCLFTRAIGLCEGTCCGLKTRSFVACCAGFFVLCCCCTPAVIVRFLFAMMRRWRWRSLLLFQLWSCAGDLVLGQVEVCTAGASFCALESACASRS